MYEIRPEHPRLGEDAHNVVGGKLIANCALIQSWAILFFSENWKITLELPDTENKPGTSSQRSERRHRITRLRRPYVTSGKRR